MNNTARKKELREYANTLTANYNEVIKKGDSVIALNDEIEQTVNEYTAISRNDCFNALRLTENPMLEAAKQLKYPTIGIRDIKQDTDRFPTRIIVDTERNIDILALNACVGGNIGKDKSWVYKMEKLNILITCKKALELNINPISISDSQTMVSLQGQIDKGMTPCSKSQILKAIRETVVAMIGEEYRALSHDAVFLLAMCSCNTKTSLSTFYNHKYIYQYVMEVCHRIVCNKKYTVEYKCLM